MVTAFFVSFVLQKVWLEAIRVSRRLFIVRQYCPKMDGMGSLALGIHRERRSYP